MSATAAETTPDSITKFQHQWRPLEKTTTIGSNTLPSRARFDSRCRDGETLLQLRFGMNSMPIHPRAGWVHTSTTSKRPTWEHHQLPLRLEVISSSVKHHTRWIDMEELVSSYAHTFLYFPRNHMPEFTVAVWQKGSIDMDESNISNTSNAAAAAAADDDVDKESAASVQDNHDFGCRGWTCLGRSYVCAGSLKKLAGKLEVPILTNSMDCWGEMHLEYLVVLPHHQSDIAFSRPSADDFYYSGWKVGHRGYGSQDQGSLVKENSLLSFKKAGHSGVSLVELDVHLSSDGDVFIYHDCMVQLVGPGSIKVPVHSLTMDQLNAIELSRRQNHERELIKKMSAAAGVTYVEDRGGTSRANSFDSTRSFQRRRSWTQICPIDNDDIDVPKKWALRESDNLVTLREALRMLPASTGMNIEVKYMTDHVSKLSRSMPHERNMLVDRILDVLFSETANCDEQRTVLLSSFDPDLCWVLNTKQDLWPVFFICWWSGPDDDVPSDPRCDNFYASLVFSVSCGLRGMVIEASYVLEHRECVQQAHSYNLLLFTYGNENSDSSLMNIQKELGVDAIICDNFALFADDKRSNISVDNSLISAASHGQRVSSILVERAPEVSQSDSSIHGGSAVNGSSVLFSFNSDSEQDGESLE